jgi:hypothetical protein
MPNDNKREYVCRCPRCGQVRFGDYDVPPRINCGDCLLSYLELVALECKLTKEIQQ